jgi:hypothetical protein
MTLSQRIARILGPTMIALGTTEAFNLQAFAGNPAQVVYLNGTLLFIGGVSIVQAHNRWTPARSVLVTLTGWALLAGGLVRMAAPQARQVGPGPAADMMFALILAAGAILAYQGYGPRRAPRPEVLPD